MLQLCSISSFQTAASTVRTAGTAAFAAVRLRSGGIFGCRVIRGNSLARLLLGGGILTLLMPVLGTRPGNRETGGADQKGGDDEVFWGVHVGSVVCLKTA